MAGDRGAERSVQRGAFAVGEASALWYAAEYTRCLQVLENAPPTPDDLLIQARALYRLQRYDDATRVLTESASLFQNPEHHALRVSFLAVLLQLRGDNGSARDYARMVEQQGASLSESTRREVTLQLAFLQWLRHEVIAAEDALARVGACTDPNHEATALSIRAWIAAERHAYAEQTQLLTASLQASLRAPARDVGFIANTLHALAALCRELHVPKLLPLVLSTAKTLPWTPDIWLSRFQTLRCAAWAQSLQGDYIPGIRLLNRAETLTAEPYWRMLALLDRTWIATISEDDNRATADLADADAIAKELDWKPTTGEECAILLVAAELFARTDPRRSHELLRTFEAVRQNVSQHLLLARDDRLTAQYEYTLARAYYEGRQVGKSRHHAKRAYEMFSSIGYMWRAARSALLLYQNGAGGEWLTTARTLSRDYPRGFIAKEVRAAGKASYDAAVEERLTPRKREVLSMLCEGMSIKGIAERLGRSPNTIKVHKAQIYSELGVRNRIELIRKVTRSSFED